MNIIPMLSQDGWDNFSYIVVGEEKQAWCVDPWDGRVQYDHIRSSGWTVAGIINTHGHGDHTRGNAELAELSGAEIFSRDTLVRMGRIELGAEEALEVIEAPGHTRDHLVFLAREAGRITGILSGDVLFNFGVGNCKAGGDVRALFDTVQHLNRILPGDARLFPGHDYMETNLGFALSRGVEAASRFMEDFENRQDTPTTLAQEREINPFLRAETFEEFRRLRQLRDQW